MYLAEGELITVRKLWVLLSLRQLSGRSACAGWLQMTSFFTAVTSRIALSSVKHLRLWSCRPWLMSFHKWHRRERKICLKGDILGSDMKDPYTACVVQWHELSCLLQTCCCHCSSGGRVTDAHRKTQWAARRILLFSAFPCWEEWCSKWLSGCLRFQESWFPCYFVWSSDK